MFHKGLKFSIDCAKSIMDVVSLIQRVGEMEQGERRRGEKDKKDRMCNPKLTSLLAAKNNLLLEMMDGNQEEWITPRQALFRCKPPGIQYRKRKEKNKRREKINSIISNSGKTRSSKTDGRYGVWSWWRGF